MPRKLALWTAEKSLESGIGYAARISEIAIAREITISEIIIIK